MDTAQRTATPQLTRDHMCLLASQVYTRDADALSYAAQHAACERQRKLDAVRAAEGAAVAAMNAWDRAHNAWLTAKREAGL